MATAVYSRRIYAATGPAGEYDGASFGEGSIIVVRSMDFTAPTGSAGWLAGFKVEDTNDLPLWFQGAGHTRQNMSYHWRGRAVIELGGSVRITTYDDGWSWIVSGYIFNAGV